MLDHPIKQTYKTKDEKEKAFYAFHEEIGNLIGLKYDDVHFLRLRLNGINSTKREDLIDLMSFHLKKRKKELSQHQKGLDRIKNNKKRYLDKKLLENGINTIIDKIARREKLLAKVKQFSSEEWVILTREMKILPRLTEASA